MKNFKAIIIAAVVLAASVQAWAQVSLKELLVEYNQRYSVNESYSIVYDNLNQSAKLKDFKIEFYGPDSAKLGQTQIQTYPREGTTEIYRLATPIEGFQTVKLIIYSLYEGDVASLPLEANSVLALNQISEFSLPEDEEDSETTPENITEDNTELLAEIAKLKADLKDLDEVRDALKVRNDNQTSLVKSQVDHIRKLNEDVADLKSQLQALSGSTPKGETPSGETSSGETSNGTGLNETGAAAVEVEAGNPKFWKLATALLGLLSIGLAGLLFSKSSKPSPLVSRRPANSLPQHSLSKPFERPDDVGAIFAGSPLLAANVAAPLSAAGHLTASNLQMLSGPFARLRPAYKATGRIGYAQEGKPSSEDYAFGTGFLVTPSHVMTNRHVHGIYSQYLTGEDCGGIEFIAEKDKDASDFYAFDGRPPLLIPGLDIAIYTLETPVKLREPIDLTSIPTESLDGRNIVVIGYPDSFKTDDPDILAALEEDPIFAVKRISQGQIFRHSTDIDAPYGVQAKVVKDEKTEFPMPAISHNASTMTGNSGSPILDAKTGALLGVHFAGFKIFNKQEAANLAMAIAYIVEQNDTHIQKSQLTTLSIKESAGEKTA